MGDLKAKRALTGNARDYTLAKEARLEIYRKGYKAGRSEAIEAAKILVEALEFECGDRCAIGINDCSAREALNAYRKAIGSEES